MKEGFITVAAAIPSVKVADVAFNVEQIQQQIDQCEQAGVEIVVFPELCVTGYSCQDLFMNQLLLEQSETGVCRLLEYTSQKDIICIVGAPVGVDDLLLNCGLVLQKGRILSVVPKTYLPNYGEFYEKRWFSSSVAVSTTPLKYAGQEVVASSFPQLCVTAGGVRFGVEICEDVWAPTPPSNTLALAGADLVFNLSASDELIGKHAYLMGLLKQQSARTISGYIYSGCGFGESTQDVVYGGNALICENGRLLGKSDRFSLQPQVVVAQIDVDRLRIERKRNTTFAAAKYRGEVLTSVASPVQPRPFRFIREIPKHPFIPAGDALSGRCDEIFSIQVAGLAKRIIHTQCQKLVLGISGGLDSTLALLVCVKTMDKLGIDRRNIVGVTMPGFGTTDRTYHNALLLMKSLGVTSREVSIAKSVMQHFEDIGHDVSVHDVTYENSQARERTQILMDLSNKFGALVIGTGDLSELALGWATYNGDHMSMYGVNAGIPKTLIRHLVQHVAVYEMEGDSRQTLLNIIDTPISPELIPADEHGQIKQKTEDLVGPYELHDFYLYYFLRYGYTPSKIFMLARQAFSAEEYDDQTIRHWLTVFFRRFFAQQFKRSCLPDGPKVGSVSLSPRGDWRMASDASAALWLAECEKL